MNDGERPSGIEVVMAALMAASGEPTWVSYWSHWLAGLARAHPFGRLPTIIIAYDTDEDGSALMAIESVGLPSGDWEAEIALLEGALTHIRGRAAPRGHG